jgi:hypothetical protein
MHKLSQIVSLCQPSPRKTPRGENLRIGTQRLLPQAAEQKITQWNDSRQHRLRHRRTKGNGNRKARLTMVYKLIQSATKRWWQLNGSGLLPEVIRGTASARGQKFVAEIPKDFRAWIKPPRVTQRSFRRQQRGRGRKTPRLVAGAARARSVEELAQSHPALAAQRWRAWRIKDTQKGPLVWRVKHVLVHIKGERGLYR